MHRVTIEDSDNCSPPGTNRATTISNPASHCDSRKKRKKEEEEKSSGGSRKKQLMLRPKVGTHHYTAIPQPELVTWLQLTVRKIRTGNLEGKEPETVREQKQ